MKPILTVLCVIISYVILAQHTNVRISNFNFPNEPSISLNPKNPKYLVAGANLNNYYYSSDTGKTWSNGTLSSTYGVWGDPTIIPDGQGSFYFFHLSNPSDGNWIDRIVCQKSTNNGQSWSNGTYTGLNGTKAQDKQWAAVDYKRNIIYLTWTQFDSYGSFNQLDSSHILFSRSTDGGLTWLTPKRLDIKGGDCIDSDNTLEGAVPAVGPNGQVYVAWSGHGNLYFTRSLNGGNTFSAPKVIATMPGGWDYDIPGLQRCNGLPVTVCDISNGPNRGTIYVNWTDQRNGTTNTDVWVIKSTDGGATWSTPVRVNDDNSNRHQFLTWMAVDQSNGRLYFVFYDRRNYADSRTDVYMARSNDGGQTFTNFKISETPFTPNSGVFFGDYNNLTAYKNIVRPMWTRMDGGNTSVWTALVNTAAIGTASQYVSSTNKQEAQQANEIQPYPNPVNNIMYVSFKIHASSKVTVQVYDNNGRLITTPVADKTYNYGKYVEQIDFAKLSVPNGVYYIQLKINDKISRREVSYLR